MRVICLAEKKQRGCQYCANVTAKSSKGELRTACPFYKCPYTVLEKYKSYEEFLASEDSKIMVNEFFITIARVFESSTHRKFNKIFSDGDARVGI